MGNMHATWSSTFGTKPIAPIEDQYLHKADFPLMAFQSNFNEYELYRLPDTVSVQILNGGQEDLKFTDAKKLSLSLLLTFAVYNHAQFLELIPHVSDSQIANDIAKRSGTTRFRRSKDTPVTSMISSYPKLPLTEEGEDFDNLKAPVPRTFDKPTLEYATGRNGKIYQLPDGKYTIDSDIFIYQMLVDEEQSEFLKYGGEETPSHREWAYFRYIFPEFPREFDLGEKALLLTGLNNCRELLNQYMHCVHSRNNRWYDPFCDPLVRYFFRCNWKFAKDLWHRILDWEYIYDSFLTQEERATRLEDLNQQLETAKIDYMKSIGRFTFQNSKPSDFLIIYKNYSNLETLNARISMLQNTIDNDSLSQSNETDINGQNRRKLMAVQHEIWEKINSFQKTKYLSSAPSEIKKRDEYVDPYNRYVPPDQQYAHFMPPQSSGDKLIPRFDPFSNYRYHQTKVDWNSAIENGFSYLEGKIEELED